MGTGKSLLLFTFPYNTYRPLKGKRFNCRSQMFLLLYLPGAGALWRGFSGCKTLSNAFLSCFLIQRHFRYVRMKQRIIYYICFLISSQGGIFFFSSIDANAIGFLQRTLESSISPILWAFLIIHAFILWYSYCTVCSAAVYRECVENSFSNLGKDVWIIPAYTPEILWSWQFTKT